MLLIYNEFLESDGSKMNKNGFRTKLEWKDDEAALVRFFSFNNFVLRRLTKC
jgi:hypothetical protein